MKNINDYIVTFDGVITDALCDAILEEFSKNNLFKSLKFKSEYLHNRFYKSSKSTSGDINELINQMKDALLESSKPGVITI
jgi:hypothetical protein